MAYKINGTTVVDNSRNVCACCVTSCCITASTKLDAPSGNTASRPSSPATGSLYFDTDEGSLLSYDGSDWAAVGGGAEVIETPYLVGKFSHEHSPETSAGGVWWTNRRTSTGIVFGGSGTYETWEYSRFVCCGCQVNPSANGHCVYLAWDRTNLPAKTSEGSVTSDYHMEIAGDMYCTCTRPEGQSGNFAKIVPSAFPYGGLCVGSCSQGRVLYNVRTGSLRLFPGFVDNDDVRGCYRVFTRNYEISTNCADVCWAKQAFLTNGRFAYCGNSGAGTVASGVHCCGISVSGSAYHNSGANKICKLFQNNIVVTVGFCPESVFDCTCCFAASAGCIKSYAYTRYDGSLGGYMDYFYPHIDYANRMLVMATFYTGGCFQGFAKYCLCDGGNAACVQCTYLVQCPVQSTIGYNSNTYQDSYGGCFPYIRQGVFWCDRFIFIPSCYGNSASNRIAIFNFNYSDNCCAGKSCVYRFWCNQAQTYSILGVLIDHNCHLRVYTSFLSNCCCGLLEHVWTAPCNFEWHCYPAQYVNELKQICGSGCYANSPTCVACPDGGTLSGSIGTPEHIYQDPYTCKIVMNPYTIRRGASRTSLSFAFDPPANDAANCTVIFKAFDSSKNGYCIIRECKASCIYPCVTCLSKFYWMGFCGNCYTLNCSPACQCLSPGGTACFGVCPGYQSCLIGQIFSDNSACGNKQFKSGPTGNLKCNYAGS